MRKLLAIVIGAVSYAAWVRWSCAWQHHPDTFIMREHDVIYLRCNRCGWTSAGWHLPVEKTARIA